VLVIWFINGVLLRHNDFLLHYKLGVGFLAGKPYLVPDREPLQDIYPVGRLLLNAPLGLFPYRVSRGICWTIAVLSLLYSLRLWQRMAQRRQPVDVATAFAATAFALGLTLPWFTRDLDDCGLQLILLFMLTLGAWWTLRRRSILAGLMLAMAVTYKVTPVFFLPLLLYKRRWREAAWMVVFVAVLNLLLPAAWLGWDKTIMAQHIYFAKVEKIWRASQLGPTTHGIQSAIHQNRSLRSTIGRYLQTYRPGSSEPGSELFIPHPDDSATGKPIGAEARPHPLFVQFLDLPAATANLVVTGLLLALAAWLAFAFRRKWGEESNEGNLPAEWAALMLLCAVLSPVCWGQHLVLAIPAAVLVMRDVLSHRQQMWRKIALGVIVVFILVPQRELLGKTLMIIVLSYKLETIAVMLLLGLLLTIRRGGQTALSEAGASRA